MGVVFVVGTVGTNPVGKELDLARQVNPALKTVGLIFNPGEPNSSYEAKLLNEEAASRGITVNAVAPGFIDTAMTRDLNQEPILAAIPLGRMGQPEEVAGAVRFLAFDPAAAYITGQVLQVDGGMVMR
jgi:3-oxoacyl-[acyl-carrier protein] reductase